MTRVQYKCQGGSFPRQKINDINFVNAAMISHCVFSGCRYAQQVCVPLICSGEALGIKTELNILRNAEFSFTHP